MLKIENLGKNYPPIHANDRCTTVAEFDDDKIDELLRRGRDNNEKTMLIQQDMNYMEWSRQYAPEQHKKYYINHNLPKTKFAKDSVLDIQLGFREKDNNNREILKFIPKSSIITNVHIIAGNGTQTVFRSANRFAQQFGGNPQEWTKKVGKIESDKYIFDIHWVEHNKYGKHETKIGGKTLKK